MPVQIGMSTASYFNRMPIEETVGDIGAHGVPLCELFLNTFSEYGAGVRRPAGGPPGRGRGVTAYSVHPMSTQFEPQLFSLHPAPTRGRAPDL